MSKKEYFLWKTFGYSLLLSLFLLAPLNSYAFSINPDDEIYSQVDVPAVFPGGETAFMKYIYENLNYPEEAIKNKIAGRVIVRFVVDAEGKVKNAEVLRSRDSLLDAEAVRIISSMPQWTPGKSNGKDVASYWTVPVIFQLPAEVEETESTSDPDEKGIYTKVDVPASFPGGEEALMKFVNENKSYPVEAMIKKVTGSVVLQFTVNVDGTIEDIYVLRPVDPSLDWEAARVVKEMPNWIPATKDGKTVPSYYVLPIRFDLKR